MIMSNLMSRAFSVVRNKVLVLIVSLLQNVLAFHMQNHHVLCGPISQPLKMNIFTSYQPLALKFKHDLKNQFIFLCPVYFWLLT